MITDRQRDRLRLGVVEVDFAQLSLDHAFQTAATGHDEEVRGAVRVLATATANGRDDAGIFLLGLLVSLPEAAWARRTSVVGALRHSPACIPILFGELRRVPLANATRRYLDAILSVMTSFPAQLVRGPLEALAEEPGLSRKMRQKLLDAAWETRP